MNGDRFRQDVVELRREAGGAVVFGEVSIAEKDSRDWTLLRVATGGSLEIMKL